jgi:hypothetical protein
MERHPRTANRAEWLAPYKLTCLAPRSSHMAQAVSMPVSATPIVLRSNSRSARFCRFHDADYGLTGTNASEYS